MRESISLDHELRVAIDAARRGGEVLRSSFGRAQQVRYKGELDLVTEADETAERAIVGSIRAVFPSDRVLAEEGTVGGDDPRRLWIVDPLDGTTNFAHGYPFFCVAVALEVDGVVVLGVVYQPLLDETFVATLGAGAYLNGERIQVSTTDRLASSLVCSGFPYNRAEFPRALELWSRMVTASQAVRRDGAAAIDLCYLAMGRFDGFWERGLRPWDVAAAGLIVTEAGGRLSDYQGRRFDVYAREVVGSNRLIHEEILAQLNDPSTE